MDAEYKKMRKEMNAYIRNYLKDITEEKVYQCVCQWENGPAETTPNIYLIHQLINCPTGNYPKQEKAKIYNICQKLVKKGKLFRIITLFEGHETIGYSTYL